MDKMENRLPLEGIRVLSFTHAVMGPAASLILADFGAEVINIEPPGGDTTRRLKGFGIGYFPFFNRNKKSLAIDIKSGEGRAIVFDLVKTADVLIENFGPGTMDRLGYDSETLREINPRLIYCSLKGFFPGPYEHRVAMDEVVQMMGGLAYMTGPPGQPLRAGASIIDITGGMFGAMAVLLALFDRKLTGKGNYVKSSLFETTAFVMGQHLAYAALTEGPVPPMPVRVSAWSIYRLFETQDKEQVFVGIISEKHWRSFCEVFQRRDWIEDDRLSTNNSRIKEREWFLPEVEKLIRQYTKEEILQRCEAANICFAPITRPTDLFEDPQLNQGRGSLLETIFPDGTATKMPRVPVLVGDYDFDKRNDPPDMIGRDTRQILESIGLKNETIEKLREKQIIGL